jgi:hypothetical protein
MYLDFSMINALMLSTIEKKQYLNHENIKGRPAFLDLLEKSAKEMLDNIKDRKQTSV